MNGSLVRRSDRGAVVQTPQVPQSPREFPAAKPWPVGRYLRRLATWWVGTWVGVLVLCLVFAAHRVPFVDDVLAAAVVATAFVAAKAADVASGMTKGSQQ